MSLFANLFGPPDKSSEQQDRPPIALPFDPDAIQETASDDLDSFLHFGTWLPTPSSSAVEGAYYDAQAETLYVRWQGGQTYPYAPCPVELAREFGECSSKGRFIRDHWPRQQK